MENLARVDNRKPSVKYSTEVTYILMIRTEERNADIMTAADYCFVRPDTETCNRNNESVTSRKGRKGVSVGVHTRGSILTSLARGLG